MKKDSEVYKRQSAISVRFTEKEKKEVVHALSAYGDVAVCSRMILLAFAKEHQDSKRMWPPESKPAKTLLTEELLNEIRDRIK